MNCLRHIDGGDGILRIKLRGNRAVVHIVFAGAAVVLRDIEGFLNAGDCACVCTELDRRTAAACNLSAGAAEAING